MNLLNNNTLLMGIVTQESSSTQDSLDELEELSQTAKLTIVERVYQNRRKPDPRFYLGKGKIEALVPIIKEKSISIIIADDELTPSQAKKLETLLKIKIMDRTSLILDIFSFRAKTYEAKLQVELAQLNYLLPRLTRLWVHLSRLGGGIGTRGPGEKQLEVDKRQINQRIAHLKKKLKLVKQQRLTKRVQRERVPVISFALIGYTNAGKSTLMNALSDAEVLTEDRLFATLDPTTRKLHGFSEDIAVITDTVGFIQKLPHELVSSFRSTLEETLTADYLLHVIDCSSLNFNNHIVTVNELLFELCESDIPQLYIFNKVDKVKDLKYLEKITANYIPHVMISAKYGTGLADLHSKIQEFIKQQQRPYNYKIPYKRMDIVHLLHKYGKILHKEYENDHVFITVELNTIIAEKIMGQLHTS